MQFDRNSLRNVSGGCRRCKHDNATAHVALSVRKALHQRQHSTDSPSALSTAVAPTDCFLFQHRKVYEKKIYLIRCYECSKCNKHIDNFLKEKTSEELQQLAVTLE